MKCQILVAALLLGWASPSESHEGHADAPGEQPTASGSGLVSVSETARANLGLETTEAELRPLETTLRQTGEIRSEPERAGTVSSRIEGRVTAIYAKEGEHVRRGQPLVEIESFQVGDPPPKVQYAAPIDGVVIDRHVVAGDDVERNRHLFEIADLRLVLAVGHVFEGQIDQVAVDQAVRVQVPSYPGRVFDGVVERLGGQLDGATRSLPVFVSVPNPEGELRPHMRATLSLVTGRADLALVVPKRTVLGEFGNPFVFVQRDDAHDLFERRPVITGLSNDRFIEIIDGVLPGERVVSEGNYSLQYLPATEEPEPDAAPAHGDDGHTHEEAGPAWLWVIGSTIAAGSIAALLLGLRVRARAAGGAR